MTQKDDFKMQVTKDEGNTQSVSELQRTREQKIKKYIAMYLRDLGIPTNLKGYYYLSDAIAMCIDFPEKIHAITKELYPEVGKKHKTTGSRVERAMRHAVEVGWERAELDKIQEIFGNTVSFKRGGPTNSEFIAQIAEDIRINYQV